MSETQNQSTKPKKSLKLLIVSGLILLAIISGIFGYGINQYLSSRTSSNLQFAVGKATSEIENKIENPKPESSLPSPTIPSKQEVWTGEITLKPKDANKFEKKVVDRIKDGFDKIECPYIDGTTKYSYKSSQPIGKENYSETDALNSGNMIIVNKNLDYSSNKFATFDELLASISLIEFTKQPIDFTQYNFLTTCQQEFYGGPVIINQKKLDVSKYGYDTGKQIIDNDRVNLLLKKGDNIVLLWKFLDGYDGKTVNECSTGNSATGFSDEQIKCIKEKLVVDKTFNDLAEYKTQELLTTFALE
jgi:hypothetical protein